MIQSIEDRRSIRKYKNLPITDDLILKLLDSALLAPSGSNTQPWGYIIVKSEENRRRIMIADHNQKWMMTAPVFIVCVADIQCRINDNITIDEKSPEVEVKQIIRDTAIAVEHIVLEAEAHGLATCWTAWFEQKDMRPILNIPDDKYVCCVLTVGYPDENPSPRPRKKLENIVHYEMW